MKCLCGYEHKHGINDKGIWQENLIGNEEFIRIEGSILRVKTNNNYYSDHTDVSLFACPKCGTVRMES
jgi:hypothetical protein